MGAEIYTRFDNLNWLKNNRRKVENKLKGYNTYYKKEDNEWWINLKVKQKDQIWLKGIEPSDNKYYDVRFLFIDDKLILFEIMFYPDSVKKTVKDFFSWLENITGITLEDEDGEPFNL
ncbi:hypothetical protein PJJ26_00170 (plasmid) [Tenacibaculum finnmarkense]|nr:hypothetical protein PJJ26_00170 [Tenacibaculum finnmarkense]